MDSPTEDQRKGYLGKCALRSVKYFDVGESFLTDSLHNLYGGAMKKLLKLWFSEDFKRSNWSCFTKLTIISKTLSQYRYPSTTSRTPRPLVKFHRFKANELRLILLFAAPVFKHYLTSTIYKNYLLLVFALHLAESRSLRSGDIEDIQFLSGPTNTFLYEYPLLYTDRHNQQVIHSIDHVAQSVQNYGQLSNYSTYNFESVLGMLRATVHSTKHHAKEIANTMNLLRLAIRNTLADDFNNELKSTLEQIQSKKQINMSRTSMDKSRHHSIIKLRMKHIIEGSQYKDIQEMFQYDEVQLYHIAFVGTTRFTTRDFAKTK
ncbi:unnamed protein product [Rotaria magnacalcarata]|uniref:Uncharacterized protein n=1 Tax=Rotaria magnacalcarata TaxID=392030 RepID=A0A815WME2_9BILA|nr:unnamed protein product [Rotaria magnacalcarata]CAF4890523.1 unnamed protein product [Rotaria magnacalcarata]